MWVCACVIFGGLVVVPKRGCSVLGALGSGSRDQVSGFRALEVPPPKPFTKPLDP